MESHDDGTRKWYFPSAVSEATHDEWTVCQILVHLGLFSDIKSLRADVTDFHARQGVVLTNVEITSFYSLRPDGAAFDDKNKHCVLLKFTRPMDSVSSSETGRRERNSRRIPDTECTFTSSTISALLMVVLGTAHKPTSQREHGTPSNRPNFKTGSASSELRTPKPESLPTELANSQTAAIKLFKKFTGHLGSN